jgi:hypothetical protein
VSVYVPSAGHGGHLTRGFDTGQTVKLRELKSNGQVRSGTVIDPPAGKHAESTMVWVTWSDDSSQENVPVRRLTT